MVRSESSERGKKSKKKVLKNRSRSRSTSSGRNRRSRRSRSKERKKYRSHSCDRSRSHSNSSERTRRSRRSQSKERKQYRSHSRDKRRSRSRDRRSSSSSKERAYKRDRKNLDSTSRRYSSDDSSSTLKNCTPESAISLKEKIKVLTDRNERKSEQIIPTFEQIMKIENESFVQETFSSTNSQIPQQMTKKKKKKKQKNQVPLVQNVEQPKLPTISHENAIFGSTIETMHVGRFSSRTIGDKKETFKNFESDDLIFGAIFSEKSEVRMKRWIEKLSLLRKTLSESETIN